MNVEGQNHKKIGKPNCGTVPQNYTHGELTEIRLSLPCNCSLVSCNWRVSFSRSRRCFRFATSSSFFFRLFTLSSSWWRSLAFCWWVCEASWLRLNCSFSARTYNKYMYKIIGRYSFIEREGEKGRGWGWQVYIVKVYPALLPIIITLIKLCRSLTSPLP